MGKLKPPKAPKQTLDQLKTLRRELKQHLSTIKAELKDISEGQDSNYTTDDLNAVRENLKVRLRGVNAAIRRQGMAKLTVVPRIRRK